eukprot:SAG11_NODE_1137_length_5726_cov_8.585747_5_plen_62_part_01
MVIFKNTFGGDIFRPQLSQWGVYELNKQNSLYMTYTRGGGGGGVYKGFFFYIFYIYYNVMKK